jgi:hypothetical protein
MNINDVITITFSFFFVALYAVTRLNNTVIYAFATHYDNFNTVRLFIASLSDTNLRHVQVRVGKTGAYSLRCVPVYAAWRLRLKLINITA